MDTSIQYIVIECSPRSGSEVLLHLFSSYSYNIQVIVDSVPRHWNLCLQVSIEALWGPDIARAQNDNNTTTLKLGWWTGASPRNKATGTFVSLHRTSDIATWSTLRNCRPMDAACTVISSRSCHLLSPSGTTIIVCGATRP
jgi:hypothetical protein